MGQSLLSQRDHPGWGELAAAALERLAQRSSDLSKVFAVLG